MADTAAAAMASQDSSDPTTIPLGKGSKAAWEGDLGMCCQ